MTAYCDVKIAYKTEKDQLAREMQQFELLKDTVMKRDQKRIELLRTKQTLWQQILVHKGASSASDSK
jgi:hypothetical protein